MIYSPTKLKGSEQGQLASALLRIVGLLLEGCALHAVEFDSEEHTIFRTGIRDIEQRFAQSSNPSDLLILAGEANKTIQSYHRSLEKYIRVLTTEKHLAMDLLTKSLLQVCHTSEKSAEALRQIQKDLQQATQLGDMRVLREKLGDAVNGLCQEADRHEQQYRDLKDKVSGSPGQEIGLVDHITGLLTLKHAEARINDMGASGREAFVAAFFLRNVDLVNRRFGFAAGDGVLQRFTKYLTKNFQGNDQLFRWRGPCFVAVVERSGSIEMVKSEAHKVGISGPEQEVENEGKSMLFRLSAATAVFPVEKAPDNADLFAKIDRFASEQFKKAPALRSSRNAD